MYNIELIEQSISASELVDMLGIEETRGRIHCPFHNDSRPSMKIYSDHFHCFACGKHSKIIAFTMQYLNLQFKDALQFLAEKQGIAESDEQIDVTHIITRGEINEVTNHDMQCCIEYHKQLINLHNEYLDTYKQCGYHIELYDEYKEVNEDLWIKLNQWGIDTVIQYINYFKKIEKILTENWEIPDNKEIYLRIKNNKAFAKALKTLLK